MYCHLVSEKVVNTIEIFLYRINERFSGLGISKVVAELLKTGQEANDRCRWVAKPLWHFRVLVWLLVGLIVISFGKIKFSKIESLTNGLSRKIWQKIMILQTLQKGQSR